MTDLPTAFRTFLFFSTVAAVSAAPLDELATDSPFTMRDQTGVVAPPTENAQVEFRGLIATKEGRLFGLYDRAKQSGVWVKESEKSGDLVVRSYDAASSQVTVEYQGRKLTLPLPEAKLGTAAPTLPPPPPGQPNQPVINAGATPAPMPQPQAQAPSGGDAQRLEAVAAEVRRRRALRQGAQDGTAAPAPAQQIQQVAPQTGGGENRQRNRN